MKKNSKLIISGSILVVILIAIISYQAYTNKQIKTELSILNTDLKAHEALLLDLGSEINEFKKDAQSQLNMIDDKLQISSSQITDLKKDVSNIQVQSNDFTGIIDDVLPSVVSVIADRSQGSGVIVLEDGYIVTNYHVIEDARRIRVLTYDNLIYNADVVGISENADIALLRINDEDLPFLEFGDSDEVRIGERVIALGNPAGLSFTVTEGIVSATERIGPSGLRAYIQTDVPINPGNSGGPLVNIKKEIIGINNFKIGNFESLGFAIDSNHVKEVIEKIFEELEQIEEANA